MAHLAEIHAIFRIIRKEIADIIAMGRMAGYTAHLSAAPFFGWIVFTAQGMSPSGRSSNHMLLSADMAVA